MIPGEALGGRDAVSGGTKIRRLPRSGLIKRSRPLFPTSTCRLHRLSNNGPPKPTGFEAGVCSGIIAVHSFEETFEPPSDHSNSTWSGTALPIVLLI